MSEPTEALVERISRTLDMARKSRRTQAWLVRDTQVNLAQKDLTELTERLAAAEAGWQEAEHPFDKAEFDRMAERLAAAERERDELKALCHDADAETMLYVKKTEIAEARVKELEEALEAALPFVMQNVKDHDQRDEVAAQIRALSQVREETVSSK